MFNKFSEAIIQFSCSLPIINFVVLRCLILLKKTTSSIDSYLNFIFQYFFKKKKTKRFVIVFDQKTSRGNQPISRCDPLTNNNNIYYLRFYTENRVIHIFKFYQLFFKSICKIILYSYILNNIIFQIFWNGEQHKFFFSNIVNEIVK